MKAFERQKQIFLKRIGSHGVMVLAACTENRVTIRPMSVVVQDGKFYCQTDETFLKYKQVMENPRVALCYKNYSIEGMCKCIGKPHDKENIFFAQAFKKYFYASYKAYSAIATERLLEITPTFAYVWKYEMAKPYMEYWDFLSGEYRKEYK